MVAQQRTRHAKAMPKGTHIGIAKCIKKVQATGKPIIPVNVRDMFFRGKSQSSDLGKLLPDYISVEDPVIDVALPGDLCVNRFHQKLSYHVRTGINALIDWVIRLDDLEFSLSGPFSLSDWGITHSGFLKGKSNLMGRLVQRTTAAAKRTMLTLGTAIEQIFSNASPPPVDVADLISILKKFKPSLKPLLQIHVARENSTGKSLMFVKMFDRLQAVKDDGTNTYTNIMKQLPLENWVHRAMTNVHLHSLLRYRPGVAPPTTLLEKITAFLVNRVKYSPTEEDCLEYRRNGESHLVKDYSLDALEGVEEGLAAAVVAGAEIIPALKAVISGQQQPLPAKTAPEFDSLFDRPAAGALAMTITDVIAKFKRSKEAAKAAAVEAAKNRASYHPHIGTSGSKDARVKGLHKGSAVLKQMHTQGLPEQEVKIRKMFEEEETCDMLELVNPNQLHRLQRALFDAKLLETLKWRDESAAVCLRY